MDQNEALLQLLTSQKLLSPEKVETLRNTLLKDKQVNLETLLSRDNDLDQEKVAEVRADFYHLPYKNLQTELIPEEILHFLSEDISRNYNMVCFFKDDKTAAIGLLNFDFKAIEAANFLAQGQGIKNEYYLISGKSFEVALKQYQKPEEQISSALEIEAKSEAEELIQVRQEAGGLASEEDANSAPIAKIVSVIIKHAVESRASDIHIEPYEKESRVRYRIDGILHNALVLPKAVHNSVVARVKVLAKMKLDETRVPQDGHIRLIVDKKDIDFRVSTMPLANSEKVEMRILDQSRGVTLLENIGFNHHCYETIKENLKRTSGLILLTGPTGSGKTTTLYSAINILNQEAVNIATLEDPIEYQIKGVNQAEIQPALGFSFATGLRSILRQDPNVIMVGEIRDEETADLAIHAGLTGHLVLSTLHTNDAVGAAFRLLDMKIEPFLLASTLRLVIAQRLARRLCKNCRKEIKPADKELNVIINKLKDIDFKDVVAEIPELKSLEDIRNLKFYGPVGCTRCSGTGYTDRIAIAELIVFNEALRDIMINKRSLFNVYTVKENQKFISMEQDGLFKVLQGVTDLSEIRRVIELQESDFDDAKL